MSSALGCGSPKLALTITTVAIVATAAVPATAPQSPPGSAAGQRRRLITAAAQLGVSPARLAARALDAHLDHLAATDLSGCACMKR